MNAWHKTTRDLEMEAMFGDFRGLAQALGDPESAGTLGAAGLPGMGQSANAAGLRGCVLEYQRKVLVPVELPLIQQAYGLASRREIREMLELDAKVAISGQSAELAEASRRVGRRHLKAMRPMRDERMVQRYWREVEAGRAEGWHTLVYGMFLAVYSVPLRQGLMNYARQTQRGLVLCGVGRGRVSRESGETLFGEIESGLKSILGGLGGLDSPLVAAQG